MTESEIPVALVLFLLCEFLVGAIVGASVEKDQVSARRGMGVALLLALGVIVYAIVLGTLATEPPKGFIVTVILTLGSVIGGLYFGFCLWLVCLLVASAGYWSAFIVFRRFGIGPNRITLASIFAFITILAAVAALTQMTRP